MNEPEKIFTKMKELKQLQSTLDKKESGIVLVKIIYETRRGERPRINLFELRRETAVREGVEKF